MNTKYIPHVKKTRHIAYMLIELLHIRSLCAGAIKNAIKTLNELFLRFMICILILGFKNTNLCMYNVNAKHTFTK